MTYEEVLRAAAEKSTRCKVCPVCDGRACRGKVPGPGSSGSGKSFTAAVDYLNNIDIMMDVIYDHDKPVDCTAEFFGKQLSMPVMAAPCGGAAFNFGVDPSVMDDRAFIHAQLKGALDAGTIGFVPDGPASMSIRYWIDLVEEFGGQAIPTVKPWENEKIIELFKQSAAMGAIGLACDVDSVGLINLRLLGTPAQPKSKAELKELAECTDKPFVVKGIVTARAAELAAEAGAYGIVVSNHGGRIIGDAPAPVSVLQEIRSAVGGGLKLFVDGGIRSGSDVFKCLALGADAVLIGRPVCHAAIGGSDEGVKMYFDRIHQELTDAMLLTGSLTLKDITADKIRNRNH